MISMTDWIEARGMGQEADPSDVRLSANDLARLGKINALDPSKSAYSGMGIKQAQELAGQLPSAADLGLVVQQNRQLEAAGGRGYAGNVHNLQGGQTPFEALTQQIASAKGNAQSGGISTPMLTRGEGGDGPGGGVSGGVGAGDTLGHFGQEALSNVSTGMATKGLTGFGLATALGAPLGLAGKFGLTSMLTPLGMLSGIGQMAYGGLLDKHYADEMGDMGIDTSTVDQSQVDQARDAAAQARSLGMHQADAYGGYGPGVAEAAAVQNRMEDAGFLGRLGMAYDALANTDWGASTNVTGYGGVDFGGLVLNEKLAAKAMSDPNIAGAMGLDPTFGGYSSRDPFGRGGSASSGGAQGTGGGIGGGRGGEHESSSDSSGGMGGV